MKGSVDVATIEPFRLEIYAQLCGATLARAHAKAGDAVAVSAYLGSGRRFADAVTEWAMGYADLNESDHARFVDAVKHGRLPHTLGVAPG
jgi:predicted alpha/beta hydrolase